MSKRYKAEFSPKIKSARDERIIAPKNMGRLRLYRAFAIPMFVGGFISILGGAPIAAISCIGAGLGVLASAHLTKDGLIAESEYNARVISRAPGLPRKAIGAIIMGASVGIGSWLGAGGSMLTSIGVGAIATIGMMMSFGFDPIRAKGLQGVNQHEASRAADAIGKAEALLKEIREMAIAFKDRRLRLDVENLAISAEDMFQSIENDPGEYRNARRYLSVYLEGARDATTQYINLPKSQQSVEATEKYTALVRELDSGFRQKSQLMLEDNRNSLDIEIDVLRERLASEGITISKE